jgi:hypothetical protein
MMKRKIAKKLNADVDRLKLWTVKRIQTDKSDESQEVWDRMKVMEVEDGEIGFWFDDGDGVIVDVDWGIHQSLNCPKPTLSSSSTISSSCSVPPDLKLEANKYGIGQRSWKLEMEMFGSMMGIESLLMLIEVNSSRQNTLWRPEHPGGPPEHHAWPST